ncbi:LAME_0C03840g1_1 [Lachancea meyersii CBS 8951]|uniref:LAME_0C03840g1_1 n=1 Tax=Lachancea meyersii CBS 8951 TaxID=1266667 RepID=A0A1G4J0N1_9SACH|nr:LAME_0C03840g1_1 [Lachancea meyersii CBS 8951]
MSDDVVKCLETPQNTRVHSRTPSASLMDKAPFAGFLFPDLRAIYSLKLHELPEIACTEVTLFGFEIYIVEQWALERKHSTIITSYTGNSQDIVRAVKFALPESQQYWPRAFKEYYEELIQYSAPKWTEDGTLFVSTSSEIPSALNLLHVECGDLRKIWDVFKVNIGLKRLQCGGRSALLLCEPSGASCEKFTQLYKVAAPATSSQEQEYSYSTHAVVELITLVQISLVYFNLLDSRCKDGILCTSTENAIKDWWSIYGTLYLGCDRPRHEGPLGPTTVAGLISLVLTIFFKLTVVNCMPTKEPFDEGSFRSGLYLFQKKYGLFKANVKTLSVLDPILISKLFEVTPKASNTDIFKIKKVVKSTVQDIAGKGNPMQLSNGILTTDLDYLTRNVHGSILCFLWRGKSAKQPAQRKKPKARFSEAVFNKGDPTDQILKSNVVATKGNNELWADSQEKLSREDKYQTYDFEHNSAKKDGVGNHRENTSHRKESVSKPDKQNIYFRTELHRRSSTPYLPQDVNLLQIDYENIPPTTCPLNALETRRNSFSVIQDAVELWRYPFEPSPIKSARNVLFMEKSIKSQSKALNEAREHACSETSDHREPVRQVYTRLNFKLKELEQLRDTLSGKHSLVLSDMSELDSLASKLKYDLRSLEARMRDVDERMAQFRSKINSMAWTMENSKTSHLMTSSLYSNPKKLDGYARDILERANKFRSSGVILNLWNNAGDLSSLFLREAHRYWVILSKQFVPQKLSGQYRAERSHK